MAKRVSDYIKGNFQTCSWSFLSSFVFCVGILIRVYFFLWSVINLLLKSNQRHEMLVKGIITHQPCSANLKNFTPMVSRTLDLGGALWLVHRFWKSWLDVYFTEFLNGGKDSLIIKSTFVNIKEKKNVVLFIILLAGHCHVVVLHVVASPDWLVLYLAVEHIGNTSFISQQ